MDVSKSPIASAREEDASWNNTTETIDSDGAPLATKSTPTIHLHTYTI